VRIHEGACHLYLAFDVGLGVRLEEAQRLIGSGGQRKVVPHRRRTPQHFGYLRAPIRIVDQGAPIALGVSAGALRGAAGAGDAGRAPRWNTTGEVECLLFDFGAVSVMYTIPLGRSAHGPDGTPMEDLVPLAQELYENAALEADARRRVEALLDHIRPAVKRPMISPLVEDYAVYHLARVSCGDGPVDAVLAGAPLVARVLRSEGSELSAQEVEDAVACRVSYTPGDLALIDWNSAMVLGAEMEDVLAVLEYANVELLELRYLDRDLDRALEMSRYRETASWWRRAIGLSAALGESNFRQVAELQVDAAALFEEVNNALKMLGDQYLARVYRLASQRLHLGEWDTTILRKLETLDNLYEKSRDLQTNRRMELLEWIIIVLIAFEIVMSFVRH
jgi:hypothetical protein